MIDEMPYEEFLGWMNYFERRPVDWRDDDRTFKLLQIQGFKGKPDTIFASLAALNHRIEEAAEEGKISVNNLKGSVLFSKLMSAVGGDKVEI